ncbi:MAG: DUF881 domain-containing protein [Bacillus sp. (in: Bacteria)]|jgi:uncharacterized protein YlxW (UPF0749 family)|nr:DUF881 domain-containing protein [Bacillus sp. (in: firmicutes)]
MLAIQFQTVQNPDVRDTRDIWELREALLKEKELQSNLIKEIRSQEEKMAKYESERKQSKEQALRETLEELKAEAGLTDITGPGVILTIEPLHEELLFGYEVPQVSPVLLQRLVNELNKYEAEHISIADQRVINSTVIRDINGETKVNGQSIDQMPLEIKVVTKDFPSAEKLYNLVKVSRVVEEFFIDNLQVHVSEPLTSITVPAYNQTLRIRYLEPVNDKGGNG